MKKYIRVMLGRGGMFAKTCREEGYIGGNFDINVNLSDSLFEKYSSSNEKGKTKSKKSKKQEKPAIAEYLQLPRENEPKVKRKQKFWKPKVSPRQK